MQGGTTFHFVTGGIHEALDRAREAAGTLDVRVGGGVSTVRQYVKERLIGELSTSPGRPSAARARRVALRRDGLARARVSLSRGRSRRERDARGDRQRRRRAIGEHAATACKLITPTPVAPDPTRRDAAHGSDRRYPDPSSDEVRAQQPAPTESTASARHRHAHSGKPAVGEHRRDGATGARCRSPGGPLGAILGRPAPRPRGGDRLPLLSQKSTTAGPGPPPARIRVTDPFAGCVRLARLRAGCRGLHAARIGHPVPRPRRARRLRPQRRERRAPGARRAAEAPGEQPLGHLRASHHLGHQHRGELSPNKVWPRSSMLPRWSTPIAAA